MKRRRVLVVICHPVAESLVSAAGQRVVAGLRTAGHDVEVIDLYAEGFDPLLGLEGWRAQFSAEPIDPELRSHAEALARAHTLVLVHPTWFGGQPAMLKGWFDRVFTNGVAYDMAPGQRRIKGRLHNIRRIIVVTTYGSGRAMNRLQGEPGRRFVYRGLRSLCHWRCRVQYLALYGLDRIDEPARAAWLTDVEHWMSQR